MPGLLAEGEATTLDIRGAPGELGKVMVGLDLVHAQLGGKKGIFALGGTFFGPLVLGTIPPSGLLEVPVSFPRGTLLGLEGLRIDFQALTFGAEGLMFGNPSSTTAGAGLLDRSRYRTPGPHAARHRPTPVRAKRATVARPGPGSGNPSMSEATLSREASSRAAAAGIGCSEGAVRHLVHFARVQVAAALDRRGRRP